MKIVRENINEGLLDKLVGPTKEESYKKLQQTYSQEAIDWLTMLVKQMKPVDIGNKIVYYIDDQWYMYQNKKSDYLWISYDKLWSILESKYQYNYNEIINLIKGVVEMNTELKDVTPNIPYYKGYNTIVIDESSKGVVKINTELKNVTPLGKGINLKCR
jgi:hypothetical protein